MWGKFHIRYLISAHRKISFSRRVLWQSCVDVYFYKDTTTRAYLFHRPQYAVMFETPIHYHTSAYKWVKSISFSLRVKIYICSRHFINCRKDTIVCVELNFISAIGRECIGWKFSIANVDCSSTIFTYNCVTFFVFF